MNQFQSTRGRAFLVHCVLICLVGLSSAEAQKPIRLRQGLIRPEEQRAALASAPVRGPGLVLVQFTGPVQPPWRQMCESLGVRFVRYVPEDAFVVRMERANMARLKALPFVSYVGRYEPNFKRSPSLPRAGQGAGGGGLANALPVSIICSPDAPGLELASVRALLRAGQPENSSRFGRIMRGTIDPARLDDLLQSEAVLWVEPAPQIKMYDEVSAKIVAGDDGFQGTLALLHQEGYDGRGVTVSVADSGLDDGVAESMHPDLFGRVRAFFYYHDLEDASDGHSHGTHVAGIVGGNAALGERDEQGALFGLGVAPRVQIVAQRIFDEVGNYEPPPSYERLTRDAVRSGAQIGSNSWGDDTQGRYDVSAMEFDMLVRDADEGVPGDQPYILEFSAGNAGPGFRTIGSPAVGKNVIATGASQNNRPDLFIYTDGQEAMADFSSRGPCEDGRIKPDLVAPGTWIASLQSSSATDENAWLGISADYQYQGGTSQAGPHVSGGAAIFVQYYRQTHTNATPSPALVKAALINSAVDMDNDVETGPVPNVDEGWGRMDLENLILSDRQYEFIEQNDRLSTGQTYERRVVVGDPAEPLRITLVYTDVPGMPAAIPALVNDLDLEVSAPDGRFYRGNQFIGGQSIPNPGVSDAVNNVEGVHLLNPIPGEYIIRVRARNVAEDALQASPAIDQDFALVISASLPPLGTGLVFLDRSAYRTPSRAQVRVVDTDLTGQSSITVTARSTTERTLQPLRLTAAGNSGSFTGSVALVNGPATPDGALSVVHGDLIEVFYTDASLGSVRTVTARADLVPPVISAVEAFDLLGRSFVFFETDEPATSYVRFGLERDIPLAVTNFLLTEAHELALPPLLSERTYYYAVVAEDAAGNVSSNDNSGRLFRFEVPRAVPVLVVDAYFADLFEIPPLSGYTNALAAAGVEFEVWKKEIQGSPTLEDLQPFGMVMWRLPEFGDTFSPDELSAITNYLQGGGSLFVASMEVLSRVAFAGFPAFNQDTFHVESYAEDVGVPFIEGVAGDPISGGLSIDLDYAVYEDEFKELVGFPADASDNIIPTTSAVPIFLTAGEPAGLRFPAPGFDSPGRVVFLSFPLDAVPMAGSGPNNRVELVRRIVNFLTPVEGQSQLVLDRPVYKVPSLVTIEVTDADQAQLGPLRVQVATDTDPAGRTIFLQETTRSGVFRGTATIVAAGANASSNEVGASAQDTLTVQYHDESAGANLEAEATIENDPPIITEVAHAEGYVDAIITWETSEPADSLVQFGESILFERTAYVRGLRTFHEVLLTGLAADKVYYYRVVSQDQAGNIAADHELPPHHSFRTLVPYSGNWADDMEGDDADWTVVDGEETEASWTHGVPSNGENAHSPTKAWASNIRGEANGFVESFLVSPPVLLTGGNRATLQFYENFDFRLDDFDIIEGGEVLLLTDTLSAPVTLGTSEGSSGGWISAEYDLTPYVGQLVYLVWHYVLFSLDDRPRLGWMIDDVSISMDTILPGRIVISNNIAQASFVLEGPTSRSTEGRYLELTNAPPGSYEVTFGNVPYYHAPLPQNVALVSGGIARFQGIYTFPDGNRNGMSDLWELAFFRRLEPNRTSTTDSDGDGRSDLKEFMSGTNPTEVDSILLVAVLDVLPDNRLRLQWQAVIGYEYRIQATEDGKSWLPVTDWMRARATGPTTHTLLPPDNPPLFFLRLEVRP